jgi:hypothetical protein
VPEFVSNGPFRVRIYVYPLSLSHTENTENREKIIKQLSKAIWSLIPLCAALHAPREETRPPSARGTCIHTHTHTHWNMCGSVLVVFGTCVAQHRPRGDHPQVNCRPQTQSHSASAHESSPTKTCRSNKIRTIAGEQLAAPPTINGSLRQSPFFSAPAAAHNRDKLRAGWLRFLSCNAQKTLISRM